MSVRKFWLAGEPHRAVEYIADITQNALEPIGDVRREAGGSILDPASLGGGLAEALRIASLCNVAT